MIQLKKASPEPFWYMLHFSLKFSEHCTGLRLSLLQQEGMSY